MFEIKGKKFDGPVSNKCIIEMYKTWVKINT